MKVWKWMPNKTPWIIPTVLPKDPPPVFHFSKSGKPLKSSDDMIIIWGKFNKKSTKWILDLKAWLEQPAQQSWKYNIKNTYFDGDLLHHSYEEFRTPLRIYAPISSGDIHNITYHTQSCYIPIIILPANTQDLVTRIKSSLITADAAFHTWPDINGRFKMYVHKHSLIAHLKFGIAETKTRINRNNLGSIGSDWKVLGQYIDTCHRIHVDPIRKDICDLVRASSEVDIEKQQQAELEGIGILQGASEHGY